MSDRPTISEVIEEWKPQARAAQTFHDYDDGRHELKFATRDFLDKYGNVVQSIRENLCPAAISAFTDGLGIESWGTDAAEGIADAEGLTRLSELVHAETFRTGDGYTLVWPNAKGEPTPHFQRANLGLPRVSDDDPSQLAWWAKVWIDRQRIGRVNIYYPDRVERFGTVAAFAKSDTTSELTAQASSWAPYTGDGDEAVIAHSFDGVPVCWWKHNAVDQHSHGRSILTDVIPLQDGLNASLAHLLVTGEANAKPFWYLLNFQPQNASNPLAVAREYQDALGELQRLNETSSRKFDPNRQRVFTHDGPGPFGQLDPVDPRRALEIQDGFALKIARVIGVPAYWFTQTGGQVQSGESLRVLTTRRNATIGRFQRSATPVWRGLAQLLGMGDLTPKWANPMELDETTKAELMEAKLRAGYAFADAVKVMGEADEAGIVTRAEEARARNAAAAGRAFRSGEIGF